MGVHIVHVPCIFGVLNDVPTVPHLVPIVHFMGGVQRALVVKQVVQQCQDPDVPIIVGLVAFTAYSLMLPEPELEVMDLDAIEFSMPEMDMLIVASNEPTEEASENGKPAEG